MLLALKATSMSFNVPVEDRLSCSRRRKPGTSTGMRTRQARSGASRNGCPEHHDLSGWRTLLDVWDIEWSHRTAEGLEMSDGKRQTPVEGPSAWTAAELQDDRDWVHQLSASEVAELDAALERALESGVAHSPFSKEEFHLPTLQTTLETVIRQVEQGRGVALLKGIPVERYDRAALRALYWWLSTYLGEAISQTSRGEMIASVTDRATITTT